MSKLMAHNLRALLIVSLLFGIGYCFGGKIGIGIALVVILIMQVL